MNHNHLSCSYLVLHIIASIVHCIILPSATAGEDYTAISQQFTFGPNTSTSFCVSVDAVTDDEYEDSETLSLTFTSADQSVNLHPDTATVTIQDDTSKPQHMFHIGLWLVISLVPRCSKGEEFLHMHPLGMRLGWLSAVTNISGAED